MSKEDVMAISPDLGSQLGTFVAELVARREGCGSSRSAKPASAALDLSRYRWAPSSESAAFHAEAKEKTI
jgi:hypothetical protein